MRRTWTMPFGATLHDGVGRFRLWAPSARVVELIRHRPGGGPRLTRAERGADGWYEVRGTDAAAGQLYQWRIDGERVVPDPASRCNPEGPHGPSMLVDPLDFEWDAGWHGRPWHEMVFYQLHIGTWTRAGTFAAAAERLPELAAIGITALQLMPLADFPGEFGWGYDGVLPFAPFHGYGAPDDLKRFVQAAHRLGLMVFGDVVYNHFGPDGNHLHDYAAPFFAPGHTTAWGDAINFEHDTVRSFFVDNALYWLHEYHFDGLRLDAVHAMLDDRRPDVLQELSGRVRAACRGRQVHLVLENDGNDAARLAAPGTPGRYEAQWNGDLHHALHVLLTGERQGYYAAFDAPLAQTARCLASGFVRPAGAEVPLGRLVQFLQTHDQIGNRAFGERLTVLADAAALRLATAIVLLMPSPPLLFMGEEFGARTPFLYFADWQGDLREAVRRGRQAEWAGDDRHAAAARAGTLPDPCSRETFERCRLDAGAAAAPAAAATRAACAELIALRTRCIAPWLPRLAAHGHRAALQGSLLQVCWRFDDAGGRCLQLQANLGAEAVPATAPDPAAEWLHGVGDVGATLLGPWSGRWHWSRAEAREAAPMAAGGPSLRAPTGGSWPAR